MNVVVPPFVPPSVPILTGNEPATCGQIVLGIVLGIVLLAITVGVVYVLIKIGDRM